MLARFDNVERRFVSRSLAGDHVANFDVPRLEFTIERGIPGAIARLRLLDVASRYMQERVGEQPETGLKSSARADGEGEDLDRKREGIGEEYLGRRGHDRPEDGDVTRSERLR